MEFKDLKSRLIFESYLEESGSVFLRLSVEEEVVGITPPSLQFYN